jgi:beta-lactamase regulating signal transducer with metallopeptidase domain
LLLRLLLCRAPKTLSYLLWSAVAFRLCCPVSWRSVLSLFRLPALQAAPLQVSVDPGGGLAYLPGAALSGGTAPAVGELSPVSGAATAAPAAVPAAVDPRQMALTVAALVWCVGVAALLLYGVVSYLRLRRRLSTAVLLQDNIYQSEQVHSPFILGLIRPRIYIPYHLEDGDLGYVLAHERYHIQRRDYLVKPFAFVLLSVHWFNPLCYLAFYLMGRDMEMSCDEKVLSQQAGSAKAYSALLLSFAASQRFPAPSPLAFGETGVAGRIRNALRWKKPKAWVTLAAALLCVLAVAACAANPAGQTGQTQTDPGQTGQAQTGQYASMESFAQQTMAATEGSYYSVRQNAMTTANVLGTRLKELEKTGEVADLAPEGTLESWQFQYYVQIDADPDDVASVDGMLEAGGWYDLEGQGGHDLVALRYADGSYDVLYDEPIGDGLDFWGYHHSYEEAIYDWYVREYGLDLPLYVVDLLPYDELGNHPARRYDGDGWYLYILLSQWSDVSVSEDAWTWTSNYGTGSTLTVRRALEGEPSQSHTAVEGRSESYFETADGVWWAVSTQYDPARLTDHPYIALEPTALEVMAESFTVDGRITAG